MNLFDIPVFIPAKVDSVRCPGKNKVLLPYILKNKAFIPSGNTYVILNEKDHSIIDNIVKYNVGYYIEPRKFNSEHESCLYFAEKLNAPYFFLYSTTTPFKNKDLLQKMAEAMDKNTDTIFSTRMVTDRSRYYLGDNGEWYVPNIERKGCDCKTYEMADGAVYLIRTDFLKENGENFKFWNNCRKKTVINDTPVFIDVDTEEDMKKFQFLASLGLDL